MSWAAFDEARDEAREAELYGSDSEIDEWENKGGEVRLIVDLETPHLENIIRGLKAGKGYYGQGHKLRCLELELSKRIRGLK